MCLSCNSACYTCSGLNECTACNKGYFLSNNVCQTNVCEPSCDSCNGPLNSNCLSCISSL